MAISNLDQKQSFALLAEMTSTRNLLAYGLRVIRTAPFIETTRDPIFTMLSIGTEKLFKLTIGLVALDKTGRWPDASEMKKLGHRLVPMHQYIVDALRDRTTDRSQYVQELVASLEADVVVLPIISALDTYGRMGRFYYLDELGSSVQAVSPDTAWQEIECAALKDPVVADLWQQAQHNVGDNLVWARCTQALNDRIAGAVERIWTTIAVCGRNRALGETGVVFGFEIHPDAVGRQWQDASLDGRGAGLPRLEG